MLEILTHILFFFHRMYPEEIWREDFQKNVERN